MVLRGLGEETWKFRPDGSLQLQAAPKDLKRFSIYNLYQECNLRGQGLTFNSAPLLQMNCQVPGRAVYLGLQFPSSAKDDEMFSFLVSSSDAKIDQIIQQVGCTGIGVRLHMPMPKLNRR